MVVKKERQQSERKRGLGNIISDFKELSASSAGSPPLEFGRMWRKGGASRS